VYTGSTIQALRNRFRTHEWRDLIRAETTRIDTYEIKAELNVAASGQQSLRSAQNEAMRAAEQVVLKRTRAETGVTELNIDEAAAEANIDSWAEIHNVILGPRTSFKPGSGGAAAAFGGLQMLQLALMWRDMKLARYVMAPYLLEDEHGVFTLAKESSLFSFSKYYKEYKTGQLAGQEVEISKDEYSALKEEAEILWGTTDFWGDWVPGLLLKELPEVDPRNAA